MSEFELMQKNIANIAKTNHANVDMSDYPDEIETPMIGIKPPIFDDENDVNNDTSQMPNYYEEEYPQIEHNDEVLFDGGPMISEIESWKKQYDAVYIVDDIPGDMIYIYRTLNRFEYKSIMAQQNTDPLMREEMICETCVLFPQDFSFAAMSNMDAGVPSILAEHIMETSGFTRASQPRRL